MKIINSILRELGFNDPLELLVYLIFMTLAGLIGYGMAVSR